MLNTGSPNAVPIRLALALTVFNFIGANAMRVLVTLYVLELGAAPWVVGVVGGLLYLFPLLLSWPIGAMADRRSALGMLAFAAVCAILIRPWCGRLPPPSTVIGDARARVP